MSKEGVLRVLEKAAEDDSFLGQLEGLLSRYSGGSGDLIPIPLV